MITHILLFGNCFPNHTGHLFRCLQMILSVNAKHICYTKELFPKFRGPRMGGWIRRGWISRFWGHPDFQSRSPKILILKGLGASGLQIGVPQKRKIQPRRIQPPPLLGLLRIFRESETTIKIKRALFRGAWAGAQGGKLSKTLFFMGNVMTMKFWKWKFYCRMILLSWRRLLIFSTVCMLGAL